MPGFNVALNATLGVRPDPNPIRPGSFFFFAELGLFCQFRLVTLGWLVGFPMGWMKLIWSMGAWSEFLLRGEKTVIGRRNGS